MAPCDPGSLHHCDPSPKRRFRMTDTAWGVLLGFLTVLFWAIYNVGSDMGDGDGFRPTDLVFFRFCGGGLCLLPLLIASRKKVPSFGRLMVLCLLAGPAFGYLVATGFRYVPLAHAVVVPPSTSMIVATLLVRFVGKEKLSSKRLFGIAILLGALVLLAVEVPGDPDPERPVWIGDLCFIASGTLWGGYTFLMARWQLHAAPTVAAIAVTSGLIYAPIHFYVFGLVDLPFGLLAEQFFYQSVMGGALSFVAFAATVSRLGAGRAALFFSLVPPSAVLLAVPMTGQFPTTLQTVALLFATVGIAVALELKRSKRRAPVSC